MKPGSSAVGTHRNLLRRLWVTTCFCLIVTISIVVVFGFLRIRADKLDSSREQLQTESQSLAKEIEALLFGALNTAESLEKIMERIKADEDRLEITRLDIRTIMSSILQAHPDYMGVFTAWEPEILDGLDGANKNQAGCDAAGRMLPYFQRNASGQIQLGYVGGGSQDSSHALWYETPKSTKRPLIAGPFMRQVSAKEAGWVITAVIPIMKGDKFLGIAGIDLPATRIQELLKTSKLSDAKMDAWLLTKEGLMIASRNSSAAIATKSDTLVPGFAQTASNKGAFIHEGDACYMAFSPLKLGKSEGEWWLALQIPKSQVTGQATQASGMMLLVGLMAAGLAIIWLTLQIRSVSKMVKSIASDLQQNAETMKTALSQLNQTTHHLAEGASNQASSLEETSSSLEEMASMTHQNAENAHKAKELARQTRTSAESGASDLSSMGNAMNQIKSASDDIAKIIKTIDEIAFQTNILALNAAVEAARAGEAGMGFAVVADEVRNLAQRSAQAARDTASIIESAIGKSEQGVIFSSRVSEQMQGIISNIRKVDELVAEVAHASTEQNQGITQLNQAVAQIDEVTQQNAASAQEGANAVESLNAQSESLQGSITTLLALTGNKS